MTHISLVKKIIAHVYCAKKKVIAHTFEGDEGRKSPLTQL